MLENTEGAINQKWTRIPTEQLKIDNPEKLAT